MGSWDSAPAAILAVWALLSSIHALDIDHTTEWAQISLSLSLSLSLSQIHSVYACIFMKLILNNYKIWSRNGGLGRRVLLSFKETPHGTNLTFDCSPSGPCVPCAYSEKVY
jgi:hypothetical protein